MSEERPTPPAPFEPEERQQLFRFCLYGFLKNQQYYEPFLILALRAAGLSFTKIGLLIAFRAVCVNVMEIPSGAAADVWGRRRSMIASMLAYMASFATFFFAHGFWTFAAAMLLFAVGDAFRTGTHKAMIFDWLTRQGRADEKTRIYGLTRSWSKMGSALSVALAAGIVISTRQYRWVFLLAALPYAANVVNFLLYPSYLDGAPDRPRSPGRAVRVLLDGLKLAFTRKALRTLVVESACFEGSFAATKDYLQPLLKVVAASALAGLAIFSGADEMTRIAFIVAAVYLPLNLAGSAASRFSHRAARWLGGEEGLALFLWIGALALYGLTAAGLLAGWGAAAIAGFALLAVAQNFWRPALVSRFHGHAETESAATTLSIESQAKALGTALLAPPLGIAVDWAARRAGETGGAEALSLEALWPVAAVGALVCLLGLAVNLAGRRRAEPA